MRGFCPKLKFGDEPIDDYNTIFIGSPNWFRTLAPPVMSFLRKHDFSGKTVMPFCTHGGGGFVSILLPCHFQFVYNKYIAHILSPHRQIPIYRVV
jgi:flavodoxin